MRMHKSLLLLVLVAALGETTTCTAQISPGERELRAEIEKLKADQKSLQAELTELKEILAPILERLPKPFRPQDVSTAGSPSMGSESAKIVLVEFSDLQCPYCVRYYADTFPKIKEEYVDSGKVRYVAREFPLSRIHPQAARASEAALCAGDQDLYWDLRAKIFANRQNLSEEELEGYARDVGVNLEPWKACMATDRYSKKVEEDMADAQKLAVTGTPSFVLGLASDSDPDTFHAKKSLNGAVPYEEFEKAIEGLLGSE